MGESGMSDESKDIFKVELFRSDDPKTLTSHFIMRLYVEAESDAYTPIVNELGDRHVISRMERELRTYVREWALKGESHEG